MITVDGAQGEGGGQVVRSAVALCASLAAVRPAGVRVINIRAKRENPGLMRQHMTAVSAVAAISGADVTGNELGSRELTFTPSGVSGGHYYFAVGTAGSISLVLQAVLPPLLFAKTPSVLTIEGGTHISKAPPIEFVQRVLFPILRSLGAGLSLTIERCGFFPAGGGRVVVEVTPIEQVKPLSLHRREGVCRTTPHIVLSKLPFMIAERELLIVSQGLRCAALPEHVTIVKNAHGAGNCVQVVCEHNNIIEMFSGVGKRGVPAEDVAQDVVDQALTYTRSEAPVGPYLADQLMVPLTLAAIHHGAAHSFTTTALTEHSTTNMDVIHAMTGVRPTVIDQGDPARLVHAQPSHDVGRGGSAQRYPQPQHGRVRWEVAV
jgi:RNA 3'-terminal phosphate cyclase (ATP)